MQWNNGKNRGFSNSDRPYLPTDNREDAPTVATQENDPVSLLSFTKQLIALHKNDNRLWADGGFHILLPEYPFVYERGNGSRKLFVAINPSQYTRYYDAPAFSKIHLSQNVLFEGERLVMEGVSFIIAEE